MFLSAQKLPPRPSLIFSHPKRSHCPTPPCRLTASPDLGCVHSEGGRGRGWRPCFLLRPSWKSHWFRAGFQCSDHLQQCIPGIVVWSWAACGGSEPQQGSVARKGRGETRCGAIVTESRGSSGQGTADLSPLRPPSRLGLGSVPGPHNPLSQPDAGRHVPF